MGVFHPRILAALAAHLDEAGRGRIVHRVFPVERHGVHLEFQDHLPGLRIDTRPFPGAALFLDAWPARLRGGRGAWPDGVAFTDTLLTGRSLESVEETGGPTLAFRFAGDVHLLLRLGRSRRPAALLLLFPDGARNIFGPWGSAGAAGQIPREAVEEQHPAVPPAPEGTVGEVVVGGLGEVGEEVRTRPGASWKLVPGEEAGESPGRRFASVSAAVAAWYERAGPAEALEEDRDRLEKAARRERDRLRRGFLSLDKEESASPDPQVLREIAGALLAAGPGLIRLPGGAWSIPDPCKPEVRLEYSPGKPGSAAHQEAARLYEKARKQTRGRTIRAQRRALLASRLAAVESLLPRLAGPSTAAELEALAEEMKKLGLAGEGPPRRGLPASAPAAPAGQFRLFRSPSGFEVLAGRHARQNDLLTFKTAAPEDLWFHVQSRSGAHVILRTGKKAAVPREDQLFAARVAAAWSGIAEGEAVDVLVARRCHVRKPKGAAPGLVKVGKFTVLRVRVERMKDPREAGPHNGE